MKKKSQIILPVIAFVLAMTGCTRERVATEPKPTVTIQQTPTQQLPTPTDGVTVSPELQKYNECLSKFAQALKVGYYKTEDYTVDLRLQYYGRYIYEEVVNNIFVLKEISEKDAVDFATDMTILIHVCCDEDDDLSSKVLAEYLMQIINTGYLTKEEVTEIFNQVTEQRTFERFMKIKDSEGIPIPTEEPTPEPTSTQSPTSTPTPEPTSTNTPTPSPIPIKTFAPHTNRTFANMGRLQIPSIDIDVAVTDDCTQANCDKQDLAIYYEYGTWEGCTYYEYIGDHSNQEFRNLPKIQVGDKAYLYNKEGKITRELECEEVVFNILYTEYEGMKLNGEDFDEMHPDRLYLSTCCPKDPIVMVAVMKDVQ